MMSAQDHGTSEPENEEDLRAIFGQLVGADIDAPSGLASKRRGFLPWHHPVKQVVRDRQWADLTVRLIKARATQGDTLRYFTLPGADLLDVRVLAEKCSAINVRIEYFGFNSGYVAAQGDLTELNEDQGAWISAESALRQANRITGDAVILPDRLEDIAINNSQAAEQLRLRDIFDVVNIDACDHLAYKPTGRDVCTFDALNAILKHQMVAKRPWLLFITTRVHPDLLGQPGLEFQRAISENLRASAEQFGGALAEAIGADPTRLLAALAGAWASTDSSFLKLYTIGLGKFLLQFFHAQPNLPALVELASAYAYRVHGDQPDMLALAFRISPEAQRAFPANAGGVTVVPSLEPQRAVKLAERAQRLQDLDRAMEAEPDLRSEALRNTESLLRSANYDEQAWRDWLAAHPQRPMTVDEVVVELS
ncbi:hypothetical protein [Methylobacterium sp. Leaf91]|uniref:PP_RS20740 family protein n=1 Tax=Methylobacterium sp. Leaf91 TaxID=1736247 RepID=UPI0012E856E9|nr:hypothetical protein [Methylobacterium sp. Leaf91]